MHSFICSFRSLIHYVPFLRVALYSVLSVCDTRAKLGTSVCTQPEVPATSDLAQACFDHFWQVQVSCMNDMQNHE